MNSNTKKQNQLGMPYGTANARLRKSIMFDMSKKLGLNICFRCGIEIKNESEFSIEHKIPYLDSKNPIELFFNLDNISFSHLSCNISASRGNSRSLKHPSSSAYKNGCRCDGCKNVEKIRRRNQRLNGINT